MPSYYNDDFLNDEQQWEEIKWEKKTDENKEKQIDIDIQSFNRQLIMARQKAYYTINRLSQAIGVKVKELEMYENGTKHPNNTIIKKINKILNSKLELKN